MGDHSNDETDRLTPAPQRMRRRGDLTLEDRLDDIERKQDQILQKLGDGQTLFATNDLRISSLEKIVYGICAIIGVAIVGAVLALVVRKTDDQAKQQVIYMQQPQAAVAAPSNGAP